MVTDEIPFHEAGLLKLNCDKALFHLGWHACLYYSECVQFIGDWYGKYYAGSTDMLEETQSQIARYEDFASSRGISWSYEP